MATLRVVRGAKLAGITAQSARSWAAPVSKKLEKVLEPFLEPGETLPDVLLLQKLIGRLLASRKEDLQESDQQNLSAVSQTRILRMRRDEVAKELREVLRAARFYFEHKNGRGEGARLGIGNGLSYMSPVNLARTGVYIATQLEADRLHQGSQAESLLPAENLEIAVRQKTAELEEVLGLLQPQSSRENLSRAKKYRSTEATEKAIRAGSAVLAGLYKLSEFEGLAEKVRPVFRRRRRKSKAGRDASVAEPAELQEVELPLIAAEVEKVEAVERPGTTLLGLAARLLRSPRTWLRQRASPTTSFRRRPESSPASESQGTGPRPSPG